MKALRYEVLMETKTDTLNALVNARLAEGWELAGGLFVNPALTKFCQAVALKPEPVPPRPKGLTRWVKTATGGFWERLPDPEPAASPA